MLIKDHNSCFVQSDLNLHSLKKLNELPFAAQDLMDIFCHTLINHRCCSSDVALVKNALLDG